MAANAKLSFCFVLVLVLASFIVICGARPLNNAELGSGSSTDKGMEVLSDSLSLAIKGIKSSGPSSGGKGHAFGTNSGPSQGGKGHAFTTSGPSGRGEGNAFTDAFTNSGPSGGGEGNAFTNSGPSSGGKGHALTHVVTDSGPSSGGNGH